MNTLTIEKGTYGRYKFPVIWLIWSNMIEHRYYHIHNEESKAVALDAILAEMKAATEAGYKIVVK